MSRGIIELIDEKDDESEVKIYRIFGRLILLKMAVTSSV
jgi:hypothetical protein